MKVKGVYYPDVVMVLCVYAYHHTHQIVCIKYIQTPINQL